jgi:hypothetical protein
MRLLIEDALPDAAEKQPALRTEQGKFSQAPESKQTRSVVAVGEITSIAGAVQTRRAGSMKKIQSK